MMSATERAKQAVKNVRDTGLFNVITDETWQREIENAIKAELSDKVPATAFLELYDAAHAVIDHIRMHVDHAEYEGSMNAVSDFREIAAQLRWEYADNISDPFDGLDDDFI